MNGKIQAIHYHHSNMAPISVMSQRNFGICQWYLKWSTNTPACLQIENTGSNKYSLIILEGFQLLEHQNVPKHKKYQRVVLWFNSSVVSLAAIDGI